MDDVTHEWKGKEERWLEEKKALVAEAERIKELLKKKSAADEVSNNVDEGKIDPVVGNDSPKVGVVPVPAVLDKNSAPAGKGG